MPPFAAVFELSTLDGTNGFRLDGIDAGDQSGRSVASAGDVNGDGFDDIIVGAWGADPGGDSYAGETYVVFGKSGGFSAALDLSALDGTNGFRIDGIVADDYSGYSVSSAGDVNGDGFDDIIVGAHGADPGGDLYAGATYVVFGKTGGFSAALDLSALDGTNGFRIDGLVAYDRSGFSVGSAGDVNGDGFDDILVGAWGGNPGASYAGETYVVFGANGGFGAALDLTVLDGTNGFRIDGIDGFDFSGFSVGSAGDVNGDGFDDIIVGARGANPGGDAYAGETYVVFGKSGGFSAAVDLSALDGTNGFRIDGIDAFDYSGWSVGSAGDVNGDGFDDMIVGARGADPGGDAFAGETYVVFGKNGGFGAALDLTALDGTNGFRLDGIDAGDWSAFSVNSAGDVNGDGFDDVIVGAYRAGAYAGETYVVFGKNGGFSAALDLSALDGTNGFRIDGIAAAFRSGRSVNAAGDVNGDGFDDVIVGAASAYAGGDAFAGQSYVIFGHRPLTSVAVVGTDIGLAHNGGHGDDTITALGGGDMANGWEGADSLYGGSENDTMFGGAGADLLSGDDGSDTLLAGDGDDVVLGGSGFDYMLGEAGDDVMRGGSVADTILGGAGDDNMAGQGGLDTLIGDAGADVMRGNTGRDFLDGGAGADALAGRSGADTLDGGDGNDFLTGKGGADRYIYSVGGDQDTIRTFAPGVGVGDVIHLVGFGPAFDSFTEVMLAASDNGADTTIDFGGGDMLLLKGVIVSQLASDDFTFG